MAATKPGEKSKEPNYVHQNSILCETVTKENRHQRLFTNYSINPFRKIHLLADKPNSSHDGDDFEEDGLLFSPSLSLIHATFFCACPERNIANFLQIIERANQEPVKKYVSPQTESQEYGWINKPLIEPDITDRRLNFRHQNTCITKYMDIAWRMKEVKETAK